MGAQKLVLLGRHGYAAACDPLEALRFPTTSDFPAEEGHVDSCIERPSLMMKFNLTYRMMCQNQRELFGVAYDFEVEEIER